MSEINGPARREEAARQLREDPVGYFSRVNHEAANRLRRNPDAIAAATEADGRESRAVEVPIAPPWDDPASPEALRYAAQVVQRLNLDRGAAPHGSRQVSPSELRDAAERAEDAAAAADAEVEALAHDLEKATDAGGFTPQIARRLIAAGWTRNA